MYMGNVHLLVYHYWLCIPSNKCLYGYDNVQVKVGLCNQKCTYMYLQNITLTPWKILLPGLTVPVCTKYSEFDDPYIIPSIQFFVTVSGHKKINTFTSKIFTSTVGCSLKLIGKMHILHNEHLLVHLEQQLCLVHPITYYTISVCTVIKWLYMRLNNRMYNYGTWWSKVASSKPKVYELINYSLSHQLL